MKHTSWFLVLAAAPTAVADDPPIATDRPGFSDGSTVLPVARWQLESGFFRAQAGSDVVASIGDLLVRYGVSPRFEARLVGVTYGTGFDAHELLDPSVGFKYLLSKTSAHEITFTGQTTVPIGAGVLRSNAWNPTAKVAWTLPVGVNTLGGNLVVSHVGSGSSQFNQGAATLFYSVPVSATTSLTGEFWALSQVAHGGDSAGFTSLAVTHLLTPNNQLDLRIGTGFNQSRDGWLLQGSYSVRF